MTTSFSSTEAAPSHTSASADAGASLSGSHRGGVRVPPRTSPLLPPITTVRGTGPDSEDARPPRLRFQFGELLDLEEVRRFRARLAGRTPDDAQCDLGFVRSADGAAVRVLELELARLEEGGCSVSLHRLPRRLQIQLHLHPILRFARDADDLFTDPDLEWPGFRHSER